MCQITSQLICKSYEQCEQEMCGGGVPYLKKKEN